MPSRKFGHNSNYDESGMPLGTTTADYDNADERRKNMVKSMYEDPIPLNDPEYQPKQLPKKVVGLDRKHGLPHGEKGFNSALYDDDVENMPVAETVDIEDPSVRKEMLVTESVAKGWDETPELPKTEKQENVDSVKSDIKEDKGTDFLDSLEDDKPDQSVEVKRQEEESK